MSSPKVPFTSEVAYSSMPKSVRVGCYDFRLEPMTKRESGAEEAYGVCHFDDLLISYAEGHSPQLLGNTILHELLHAVHFVMGLPTGSETGTEEMFTTAGTNGLQILWRDNPQLITWLNRCFTQGT